MGGPETGRSVHDVAGWKRILWGGFPDFCAVVPVVWCLSYAVTGLHVGAQVGRQSSTAALGPGLAIMAAPFLAAAGLMSGRLARYMLGSRISRKWIRPLRWCAPLVLMVVGVLGSRHASGPIHTAEREARPRVLMNVAQMHRRVTSGAVSSLHRATRIYDHVEKVIRPLPWQGGSVMLADAGDALEVHVPAANPLRIPLPGIDYILYVDAIALRMGAAGRPALALLITGRATGRRDLIAVVSPAGELLYLELLNRFWDFRQVPLAITATEAGDLVLVGTEQSRMLVFSQ